MSIDYGEQYWTKFEEIVFNVTDALKDINDVITEQNSNDINNVIWSLIKKVQELLKLNEKEEYINFVDLNIESKIIQLQDILQDAVEEIADGEYDSAQTEISTLIDKAEEIIDIYDKEY